MEVKVDFQTDDSGSATARLASAGTPLSPPDSFSGIFQEEMNLRHVDRHLDHVIR